MSPARQWLGLVAVVAWIGMALLLPRPATADDPTTTAPVRLTPHQPSPGDDVTIEVGGFAPGAPVDFFVDRTPIAKATADGTGTARATTPLPADTSDPYQVIVVGQGPNGVRHATPVVVQTRWPEAWVGTDRERPGGLVAVAAALALLLAGSAAVIISHRRRVEALS